MKKLLILAGVLALASGAHAYDRNQLNFWGFQITPQNKVAGANEYAGLILQRFDATLRRVPLADYTPKYSGTSCVVDIRIDPPRALTILNADGDKIACDFVSDKLKEAHFSPIDASLAKRVKAFEVFFQFTDYEQYLDNSK